MLREEELKKSCNEAFLTCSIIDFLPSFHKPTTIPDSVKYNVIIHTDLKDIAEHLMNIFQVLDIIWTARSLKTVQTIIKIIYREMFHLLFFLDPLTQLKLGNISAF